MIAVETGGAQGAPAPLCRALLLEFLAAWRDAVDEAPAHGAVDLWRQISRLRAVRPDLYAAVVAHPGDPLHDAVDYVRRYMGAAVASPADPADEVTE